MRLFNKLRPYIGIKTILTAMAITAGLYFGGMVAGISVGVVLFGLFAVGRLIARLRSTSAHAELKQAERADLQGGIGPEFRKELQQQKQQHASVFADVTFDNSGFMRVTYTPWFSSQLFEKITGNSQTVFVIDEKNKPVVSGDDNLPALEADGPAS